jgi:hypothetical protein
VRVLLFQGSAFPLDSEDADWLAQRIRTTCVDASHRPRDVDALACLQLADALSEEPRGHRLEPVEVTHPQARGLIKHVLASDAAQERGMHALRDALVQFSSDNA